MRLIGGVGMFLLAIGFTWHSLSSQTTWLQDLFGPALFISSLTMFFLAFSNILIPRFGLKFKLRPMSKAEKKGLDADEIDKK